MSVQFSAAQVEAIAALAQLELEPGEVELFARQLGDFLRYAEAVQAVDTAGVEPTAYVLSPLESDRPDLVRPSLEREAALSNAPEPSLDGALFKVPRVIG